MSVLRMQRPGVLLILNDPAVQIDEVATVLAEGRHAEKCSQEQQRDPAHGHRLPPRNDGHQRFTSALYARYSAPNRRSSAGSSYTRTKAWASAKKPNAS